jgi:outer membrane protein assembly factor BamD (BamD/ComL family)
MTDRTGMTQRTVGARLAWAPIALLLAGACVLASCVTSPDDLTGEITPAEYFQHAQEATAVNDFRGAMAWYEAFRERYADNPTPGQQNLLLWAEYEVAFLHHKMGNDRLAIHLLGELIARYDTPDAATYAPAPRILALRVIDELQPGAAGEEAGAAS